MKADENRLSKMRSHLDHLDKMNGIADPEYWLRRRIGEDGLRDLYHADYLTTEEFERWIEQLYSLPGALANALS